MLWSFRCHIVSCRIASSHGVLCPMLSTLLRRDFVFQKMYMLDALIFSFRISMGLVAVFIVIVFVTVIFFVERDLWAVDCHVDALSRFQRRCVCTHCYCFTMPLRFVIALHIHRLIQAHCIPKIGSLHTIHKFSNRFGKYSKHNRPNVSQCWGSGFKLLVPHSLVPTDFCHGSVVMHVPRV